jgi:hypothetical protein
MLGIVSEKKKLKEVIRRNQRAHEITQEGKTKAITCSFLASIPNGLAKEELSFSSQFSKHVHSPPISNGNTLNKKGR